MGYDQGIHFVEFLFTGYMEVMTSEAVAGMHVPMSTPEFNASKSYCLRFDYNLFPMPSVLGVYARTSNHVNTGRKLWFTENTGYDRVQVQIWPKSTAILIIDFIAIIADPETTVIKVASVQLNEGICNDTSHIICGTGEFPCRNGQECILESLTCDGISHCMDESDELLSKCGM